MSLLKRLLSLFLLFFFLQPVVSIYIYTFMQFMSVCLPQLFSAPSRPTLASEVSKESL